MADRVVYGIKSLKFMPAVTTGENAGSFPNFSEALASLYDMKMIVPDSFNMNQEDPEKLDVEWEEVEDIAMSIQTRKAHAHLRCLQMICRKRHLNISLGGKSRQKEMTRPIS